MLIACISVPSYWGNVFNTYKPQAGCQIQQSSLFPQFVQEQFSSVSKTDINMVLARSAELHRTLATCSKGSRSFERKGLDKLDFRNQTEEGGAESFEFLFKIGSWLLLCFYCLENKI